jgi:hypothetical protein
MADAGALVLPKSDLLATARFHTVLRFAVGTAAAFVLCEAMGWYPTFLAPLLAATLLANLPVALSPKAGVALVVVQGGGAYAAYFLASMLTEAPFVYFCAVGLIVFVCFAVLAQGRGFLPILLVLIAFAAIPVVTMVAPQQAGALPLAFTRSMAIAVAMIWLVQSLWPEIAKAAAAPMAGNASPVALAVAGTAIVLPLMLVFLMYGITDALPVLITTIVLVITFDPRRGATQGLAMVIANLIGGATAIGAFMLLQVAANLATLFLVALLVGIVFGSRIARGGPAGGVAAVTFNQAMVLFSLALLPGGAAPGLWMTRVLQFGLAGLFAVSMLILLLPRPAKS